MEDNLQFLEANKYLIRYYYVYKHQSFHRAAENFYVAGTDRNMKYTVTQLEDFYGVQLVNIKGNKLSFTEFGHMLGKLSEKIYNLNLEINTQLKRSNLKEIRFATSPDFYKYYIMPIFAVFQKANPDAKIMLIKTNQADSTQRLLNREIDFVVGTNVIAPHPDLEYKEVMRAKILIVAKKRLETKLKGLKNLKELKGLKGAMNDLTDPFYNNARSVLEEKKIELNILYSTSDFDSLIEAVNTDLADYALVGNYRKIPELFSLDVSSFFKPVVITFIYRKGESPTKAIESLITISSKLNVKPV